MPRKRPDIVDTGIKDESLPGMPADPPPVERRGPGRPKGAKTAAKTAPMIRSASTGRAMSKAQAKAKVATELYGFASLLVGMWEMRDPECAAPWSEEVTLPAGRQDRLSAVVERVVEIFARNDAVLNAMATTGLIGEIGMLASLLWPAVKTVWQHHGPGGAGHQSAEVGAEDYAQRYPAPALA